MMTLSFSIASASDQPTILTILQEAQQWLRQKGIEQWTLPFTAEWVAECIARQEFVVAQVEERTVGVVRLVEADPVIWNDDGQSQALYIHSLAVVGDRRGYGVGRQLLEWVETYAVEQQKHYLRLDCMAANSALCDYYEQAGFIQRQLVELPSGDDIYIARLYEKPLQAGVNRSNQTMSSPSDDHAAVMQVIANESIAFWNKDFEAWSTYILHAPYIRRVGWWARGGVRIAEGWEALSARVKSTMTAFPEPNPTASNVRRQNINLRVDGKMAWVTFDQLGEDTGDLEMDMAGLSRETRILEKHGGAWKIVYIGWILEEGTGE